MDVKKGDLHKQDLDLDVFPVTAQEFSHLLAPLFPDLVHSPAIAVAVSGGSDSMALAALLSAWAAQTSSPPHIHALIVDHGLRPESAEEAQNVQDLLQAWPHITPVILTWHHAPVESRLQEDARAARYALMAEYCVAQRISHLFLGHHGDDQAETFFFRLSKGSGLDGLCAMRPVQRYSETLHLLRPFLDIPKTRLIATCQSQNIPVIHDPSNRMEKFARIRFRQSREIFAQEGLSASRLSTTLSRLSRARAALEDLTEDTYPTLVKQHDPAGLVFHCARFKTVPEEISLRCLLKAIQTLNPSPAYPPRLEKCETLHHDLLQTAPFRKRCFAGLIFQRRDRADEILITLESPAIR